MVTHQSIPKPANAKKKSDILPIPAQSKSHPVIAQPKIESTRSNEEQLAQMRAQREASERLGSTLLTPESVPRTLPPLQPKLTIGQPGDQYEQEADRVARQVVDHINAPPKIQAKEIHQPMSVGQRKPSPLDHLPAQRVQRYGTGRQMDASPDLESSIQRARGGGQPLGDGIRERMEGAFGADFSGVRVHTDGTSDQLNQSIQAKAFTTGQDVFFRKGAYEPGSRGGQELLAHELTHVVQQKGEAVQRQSEERKGEKGKQERDKESTREVMTVSHQISPIKAVNVQCFFVRIDINGFDNNAPIKTLHIPSERPPTKYGNKQHDHTTAWTLICEEVAASIKGNPPTEAIKALGRSVKMFDFHGYQWTKNLLKQINDFLRLNYSDSADNHYRNIKHLETFVEMYLEGRNAQVDAVFERKSKKNPKVSESGSFRGEAAAIGKMRNYRQKPETLDLKSKNFIKEMVDLFDPPYTEEALSTQEEAKDWIDETLAAPMGNHIISILIVLRDVILEKNLIQDINAMINKFINKVLQEIEDYGNYGKLDASAVYLNKAKEDVREFLQQDNSLKILFPDL